MEFPALGAAAGIIIPAYVAFGTVRRLGWNPSMGAAAGIIILAYDHRCWDCIRNSSWVWRRPSLLKAECFCALMVVTDRENFWAMAVMDRPCSMQRSTSCSRAESLA